MWTSSQNMQNRKCTIFICLHFNVFCEGKRKKNEKHKKKITLLYFYFINETPTM